MPLFTVTCTTCTARLSVRETSAIGQILECPKCGSMVQIVPPQGWQPPPPAPPPVKSADAPPKSIAPAPPAPRAAAAKNAGSATTSETASLKPSPRQTDATTQSAAARPRSAAAPKPPLPANLADSAHLSEMAEAGLDLEAVASRSLPVSRPRSPEQSGASVEQSRALRGGDHSIYEPPPNR